MKQQFETSTWLAEQMVEEMFNHRSPKVGDRLLEPSAGHGALIKKVLDHGYFAEIYATEINDEAYQILQKKFASAVLLLVERDFLKTHERFKYNYIIANPPFEDAANHIYRMYSKLKKGGILVTLTPPELFDNSNKDYSDFSGWLSEVYDDHLVKVKTITGQICAPPCTCNEAKLLIVKKNHDTDRI